MSTAITKIEKAIRKDIAAGGVDFSSIIEGFNSAGVCTYRREC